MGAPRAAQPRPKAPAHLEHTTPLQESFAPGSSPICDMGLEPRVVTLGEDRNPALEDMTRRFWISVVLTMPMLAIMIGDLWGRPSRRAQLGGISDSECYDRLAV